MKKQPVTFDKPISPVYGQARVLSIRPVNIDYLDILIRQPVIAEHALPGQFIMVRGWSGTEPILSRPFDIVQMRPEAGTVRIVVKVSGKGTTLMRKLREGDEITVHGPLGNGIRELDCASIGLLIRGVGAAAVTALAEKARNEAIEVYSFLSASTAARLVCRDYLEAASTGLAIATDDGSAGYYGDARELVRPYLSKGAIDQLYTCGSKRFARFTQEATDRGEVTGYIFLEEQMACGSGYCHGCAVPRRRSDGYLLVCEDGPVFAADTVEVE